MEADIPVPAAIILDEITKPLAIVLSKFQGYVGLEIN